MGTHPSKAEILAALSAALDLVGGLSQGHAIRTYAIADRLSIDLGFDEEDRRRLFFACVLKDSGCSTNSARIQKYFGGDELLTKEAIRLNNLASPYENFCFTVEFTQRGKGWGDKVRHLALNAGAQKTLMHEVTEARCNRGAQIARLLGFDETVSEAIHQLDEHWDGKGLPDGIKGADLNPIAQLICMCQNAEVFVDTYNVSASVEMVRKRSGRWFDPEIVQAYVALESDTAFWESLKSIDFHSIVPEELRDSALDADIDAICEAFAMIVDTKSAFTAEHSVRVARYAAEIGCTMGFDHDQVNLLYRAGLLHDIGKLAVSSAILEKPGRLTDEEYDVVKKHPKDSYLILRRISGFETIAEIASGHHERLDGRGYWQNLTGDQIPLETRIMTVADVYDAITAERPYRPAMPYEKCREIMDGEAGTAFDPECLEALWEALKVPVGLTSK